MRERLLTCQNRHYGPLPAQSSGQHLRALGSCDAAQSCQNGLVFTFSNLLFLKRVQKVGFEEQCWSWDEPEEEEEVQLGEAGEESG